MSDLLPGDPPRCPACGEKLNGFTDVGFDGAVPKPGDSSICAYCASMLTFDQGKDGLILRFPTDAELTERSRKPEVVLARETVLEIIRRRKPWSS